MPKMKNKVMRITVSVPTEHHEQLENLADKTEGVRFVVEGSGGSNIHLIQPSSDPQALRRLGTDPNTNVNAKASCNP